MIKSDIYIKEQTSQVTFSHFVIPLLTSMDVRSTMFKYWHLHGLLQCSFANGKLFFAGVHERLSTSIREAVTPDNVLSGKGRS